MLTVMLRAGGRVHGGKVADAAVTDVDGIVGGACLAAGSVIAGTIDQVRITAVAIAVTANNRNARRRPVHSSTMPCIRRRVPTIY